MYFSICEIGLKILECRRCCASSEKSIASKNRMRSYHSISVGRMSLYLASVTSVSLGIERKMSLT